MDHCPECGCELIDPKEQSDAMRRMFFATLRDIWMNLHDRERANYPSSEAFRKAALIHTGWCDTQMTVCGSNRAAHEVALLVKTIDRYAIVQVEGPVIRVYRARSMAKRPCPKKVFHDVADKALTWANAQIGVTKQQMERAA